MKNFLKYLQNQKDFALFAGIVFVVGSAQIWPRHIFISVGLAVIGRYLVKFSQSK